MSRDLAAFLVLAALILVTAVFCGCTNPPPQDPAVACIEAVSNMTSNVDRLSICYRFVRTSTCPRR